MLNNVFKRMVPYLNTTVYRSLYFLHVHMNSSGMSAVWRSRSIGRSMFGRFLKPIGFPSLRRSREIVFVWIYFPCKISQRVNNRSANQTCPHPNSQRAVTNTVSLYFQWMFFLWRVISVLYFTKIICKIYLFRMIGERCRSMGLSTLKCKLQPVWSWTHFV